MQQRPYGLKSLKYLNVWLLQEGLHTPAQGPTCLLGMKFHMSGCPVGCRSVRSPLRFACKQVHLDQPLSRKRLFQCHLAPCGGPISHGAGSRKLRIT